MPPLGGEEEGRVLEHGLDEGALAAEELLQRRAFIEPADLGQAVHRRPGGDGGQLEVERIDLAAGRLLDRLLYELKPVVIVLAASRGTSPPSGRSRT